MLKRLFGTPTTAPYGVIKAAELKRKIDAGEDVVLVDVRSAEEFKHDGHIPGARLLPLFALPLRHAELPKDRTVVMVCRSGSRSQMACEQLSRQGFTNLVNLQGGMISWAGSGYPVQRA